MKQFAGICRGGPLDRQQFVHTSKLYEMMIAPPVSLRQAFEEPEPPKEVKLKFGFYAYVLGQWIWRDRD